MMRHLLILAGAVFGMTWTQPALAQPSRSEVQKVLRDSYCPKYGTADFMGCKPDQRISGPGPDSAFVIAGEIGASKRRFTVLSYQLQGFSERDADSRPAPECGVIVLERRTGKLAYLGHYDMPCMSVQVTGNRVVFDKPPAKWDDTNFFILNEKGPPPAIYIFGGYYTFYG